MTLMDSVRSSAKSYPKALLDGQINQTLAPKEVQEKMNAYLNNVRETYTRLIINKYTKFRK